MVLLLAEIGLFASKQVLTECFNFCDKKNTSISTSSMSETKKNTTGSYFGGSFCRVKPSNFN